MLFADLSDYQDPIDWPSYAHWSSVVAIKSSEGTSFIARTYFQKRASAQNLSIWHYHFARPDLQTDPIQEAMFFHSIVGVIPTKDRIVLDIEVTPVTINWVLQFCQTAQTLFQSTPIIYSSQSFIQSYLQDTRLNQFDLWMAYWTFDPSSRPMCPQPWLHYIALQYSDRESVPGIAGLTDASSLLEEITPVTELQLSQVVGIYYLDGGNWHCKVPGHNYIVKEAILKYYVGLVSVSAPLGGYTALGLPLENEHMVSTGFWKQRFERGEVWCEYPKPIKDNPPSNIGTYNAHLETYYNAQDNNALSLITISGLQTANSALEQQLTQARQSLIDVTAQLSLAQKALAATSDNQYGQAVKAVLDLLATLPTYVSLGRATRDPVPAIEVSHDDA